MNVEELKSVGIDGSRNGKLIIDVFTTWCGPCKFIAPILHKLRDEGLIKLIQVDLDKNRPLGEMFGITAIPTLLFFKDGKLIESNIEIQGNEYSYYRIFLTQGQQAQLKTPGRPVL